MSAGFREVVLGGCALLLTAGSMMLSGCGAGSLAGPNDTPGFKIKGNVHGGAFPIQDATIRLMQTRSNGAWSATTNSYIGTAKQVLTTTSDSNGNFTFPDTFTCTAGQYAYIEVNGGHTTAATNTNVVQLGVIGSCSGRLNTVAKIDAVNVFISELSTVATAYALNNFISFSTTNGAPIANITSSTGNNSNAPGCTGSGNAGNNPLTCVQAGLGHAFDNAYNLVDSVTYDGSMPTGRARTSIPGNAQSTVPESLINTLGNILQSCVDSGGGTVATYSSYTPGGNGSTHCGDLFYYATAPGGTPTPPTNTLQAILNIANNPTTNVDALFNLQPRAVFFTPDLSSDKMSGSSSQLMAYTLSIFYTGTGLPNDLGMPYPVDVALDENDNAYVAYSGGASGLTYGAVNEFGPNGVGVFAGAHQVTIPNPGSIALDSAANAWLSNDALVNGNVFQITTSGSGGTLGGISKTLTVTNGYAAGVATDMANNVWTIRDSASNQSIYRFNAGNNYALEPLSGTPQLGYAAKRLFVDANQEVLGVTSDTDPLGNSLSSSNAYVWLFNFANSGDTSIFHSAQLSGKNGYGIAMSNADAGYFPVYQELDTQTGLADGTITANGDGSYTGTDNTYANPMGVAMDGAGVLYWSDHETAGQIFKFVMSNAPSANAGTLTSFYPCYPMGGACNSPISSNLRAMAVDSSGAIWYLANNSKGMVIQSFGIAAPTFPLLSYAHGSVIP